MPDPRAMMALLSRMGRKGAAKVENHLKERVRSLNEPDTYLKDRLHPTKESILDMALSAETGPLDDVAKAANLSRFLKGSAIKEPVYHGSNRRFTEFNPQPSVRNVDGGIENVQSPVSFFSPDRETSQMFARDKVKIAQNITKASPGRAEVRPFYLDVKNPLDFTITPEVHSKMVSEGYSPYYNTNAPSPYAVQHIEELAGRSPEDWNDVQSVLDDPYVVDGLRDKGFDGVKLRENNGADSWGVFESGQAKHATKNRGTFDRKNPNILAGIGAAAGASALLGQKRKVNQ